MAKFIYNNHSVSVPSDFIKDKMKDINGAFVKVYLYALYLATTSKECDFAYIASELGLLESEVIKAFEALDGVGALIFNNDEISFTAQGDAIETSKRQTEEVPKAQSNILDIKQALVQNTALSELCLVAEATYGKTLSDSELQSLYWLHEELGLCAEVILMVIEYCISINKSNMKYVERVAITWKENGIDTIEKANEYINAEIEKKTVFYNIRKTFGILARPLTELEEKYLVKWHNEWNMSEAMILLAYNYCIMQTNKLSYQYMDTIIKNWFDSKIMTVEDAKAQNETYKEGKAPMVFEAKKEPLKNDNGEYDDLAELTQNS